MIKWIDETRPSKGISYLYLTRENYPKYRDKVFAKLNSNGHYVIEKF